MITVVRLTAGQSGIYKRKKKQIPVAVSHFIGYVKIKRTRRNEKHTQKKAKKKKLRKKETKMIRERTNVTNYLPTRLDPRGTKRKTLGTTWQTFSARFYRSSTSSTKETQLFARAKTVGKHIPL